MEKRRIKKRGGEVRSEWRGGCKGAQERENGNERKKIKEKEVKSNEGKTETERIGRKLKIWKKKKKLRY